MLYTILPLTSEVIFSMEDLGRLFVSCGQVDISADFVFYVILPVITTKIYTFYLILHSSKMSSTEHTLRAPRIKKLPFPSSN